jgi:predicted SAM-dependent methyltransferase
MKQKFKRVVEWTGTPSYWLRQNSDELRAMFVRIWRYSPATRGKIRRILQRDVIRLNFGCGETRYDGWCGVDCFFAPHVDLTIDLRRPLPFPSESVDWCYSEHFLEHLYPFEGQRHLIEVHRILKPRGRYRVVVPNVMEFARCYLARDLEFFRRAFPWARRPMEAFYCVANWEGRHRNILDFEELQHMGRVAGFDEIHESGANTSDVPDLRIDKDDPQRIAESLYVEFTKSGSSG